MTGEAGNGAEGAARVPGAAAWLGGAGLLPFAGLAAALWLLPEAGPWPGIAGGALVGYGAVILAFMGGCRWGFAAAGLGGGASWINLGLAVIPALFAWAAAMLPRETACALLAVGFAGLLAADIALARRGGAPAWWPRLRWPLSVGAAGSLLAGALA